jgi:hypothetical protein
VKAKNLLILALLAVVIGGVAVVSANRRDVARETSGAHARLFPGLEERINDVTAVRLTRADQTCTLNRVADGWTLAELGGYPAKFGKVKELLVGLASLDIEEEKTKNPALWDKLDLGDPTADGAVSIQVVVEGAGGEVLASVVVGRSTGDRVLIRRSGEDQTYACDGALRPELRPTSWVDTVMLRLENERIATATIDHKDGDDVELRRNAHNPANFDVANVPADREVKFDAVANSAAQALGALSFEEVRPADEVDLSAPRTVSTYRTADGLHVTLRMTEVDGAVWAGITTEFVASDAPPPEASAPEDPLATVGRTPEQVRQEAREMNERLAPWAFKLPGYKASFLESTMESFLQAVAPPEQAGPLPPAPEGPLDIPVVPPGATEDDGD